MNPVMKDAGYSMENMMKQVYRDEKAQEHNHTWLDSLRSHRSPMKSLYRLGTYIQPLDNEEVMLLALPYSYWLLYE
jgi:hypothetical protein